MGRAVQGGLRPMRLFVSYARVDKEQVEEIVAILRDGGHQPWFDRGLLPGRDWQAELAGEIAACDAFVYALSPESVASTWCLWEFAEAAALGKPVVPVLLRETELPPGLEELHYADFTAGATPRK